MEKIIIGRIRFYASTIRFCILIFISLILIGRFISILNKRPIEFNEDFKDSLLFASIAAFTVLIALSKISSENNSYYFKENALIVKQYIFPITIEIRYDDIKYIKIMEKSLGNSIQIDYLKNNTLKQKNFISQNLRNEDLGNIELNCQSHKINYHYTKINQGI